MWSEIGPLSSKRSIRIIGEKQLKIHFDLIRKVEKDTVNPIEKDVDFGRSKEVRKERFQRVYAV